MAASGPGAMARAQPGDGVGSSSACESGPKLTLARRILARDKVRIGFIAVSPQSLSRKLLNVGQSPLLLEQRLGRGVETEHEFEMALGVGRNPVRLLALRRLGAEPDVDRAVRVL